MTTINYIEDICSILRNNIKKGSDSGCGMYNFDLYDIDLKGKHYDSPILQAYPFTDSAFYGEIFLTIYSEKLGHSISFGFSALKAEEQEYIYNKIREQIGDVVGLYSFLKPNMTFEEKIDLIKCWIAESGKYGESVYDLEDNGNAIEWINLYGVKNLYDAKSLCRWWIAGEDYAYDGINYRSTNGDALEKPYILTENSIESILDCLIYHSIEERYLISVETAQEDNSSVEDALIELTNKYHGYIGFLGFAVWRDDVKVYDHYKWISIQKEDNCIDTYCKPYKTQEECYQDMRDNAISRMKCNTDWHDVLEDNDLYDTDLEDEESIGYDARFYPSYITLSSFSVNYVFLIVRCDENGFLEPNAYDKLKKLM